MEKEKHRRKKDVRQYIVLLAVLIAVFVFCGIHFLRSEEVRGYIRQSREEKLADAFLEEVRMREPEGESAAPDEESDVAVQTQTEAGEAETASGDIAPADRVDLDYTDDNYEVIDGVRYTPEYAAGKLDCVLEIPKIKMRRGVYTGTPAEIQHDLNIWMTTTAHAGYELGTTHYCIYGHNSPTQSLSFNDLKTVEPGDSFLLTTADAVYYYDVTDFFAQWRELVKSDITDNFDISADKCYIITCGRDEYRYKDIVVEGTLRKKYSIDEWYGRENDPAPETIPAEIAGTGETAAAEKEKTNLTVEISGEQLVFTFLDSAGRGIPGGRLCVTDADGLFLPEYPAGLTTDAEGKTAVPLSLFVPGEYYAAGAIDPGAEAYALPQDREFTVERKSESLQVSSEEVQAEKLHSDYYMILWAVLLAVLAGLIVMTVIRLVLQVHGKSTGTGTVD